MSWLGEIWGIWTLRAPLMILDIAFSIPWSLFMLFIRVTVQLHEPEVKLRHTNALKHHVEIPKWMKCTLPYVSYPQHEAESITLPSIPTSAHKQLSFLLVNAAPPFLLRSSRRFLPGPPDAGWHGALRSQILGGRGSGGRSQEERWGSAWECEGHRWGSGHDSSPRSSLFCLPSILNFA